MQKPEDTRFLGYQSAQATSDILLTLSDSAAKTKSAAFQNRFRRAVMAFGEPGSLYYIDRKTHAMQTQLIRGKQIDLFWEGEDCGCKDTKLAVELSST